MDKLIKCKWCYSDPLLERYHDEEWGVPVHNERKHFELLLLESMSCGLSWKLMLKKREVFKRYFADFDYTKVAKFTDSDIERIMATDGMIRSQRKIEAIINNAIRFMEVQKEFGSFDHFIWSFSKGKTLIYRSHLNGLWETSNDLSDKVSKELRHRGFKYVGTVIIYSHLQSIGIINDHDKNCFRFHQLADTGNTEVIDK